MYSKPYQAHQLCTQCYIIMYTPAQISEVITPTLNVYMLDHTDVSGIDLLLARECMFSPQTIQPGAIPTTHRG